MNEIEEKWTKDAVKHLKGRKIVSVRYMTTEEMDSLGWSSRCVILQLDNGMLIYPSMDDEGNGAGALFTSDENCSVIPII